MSQRDPIRGLEQLRQELMRAASENPRIAQAWAVPAPDQRRRRHRSGIRRLGLALGPAVAIAVAAGALLLLGRGGPPRPQPAATTCTQRLLADLRVLRRPQTARDRTFHPPPTSPTSGAGDHARPIFSYALIPRLTRLARTLPGGTKVFLAAYAPKFVGPAAALGDLVLVYIERPGHAPAFAGEVSAMTLPSSYLLPPQRSGHSLFSVVPDQVARVEWTFPRMRVPRLPHTHAGLVLKGGTATANVRGNIAAAGATPTSWLPPTVTRWFNASGHVIRTFRQASPRPAPPRPTGPITLRTKGVQVGTMSPTAGSCQRR